MNHGESVALASVIIFVHGSFLSCERLYTPSPSSPLFIPSPVAVGLADEICLQKKNKQVTQASIIVAVIAFSSSFLATITICAQSLPVSVICSVVLAFIVYLALRFSPC
jgi:hypothetical protein